MSQRDTGCRGSNDERVHCGTERRLLYRRRAHLPGLDSLLIQAGQYAGDYPEGIPVVAAATDTAQLPSVWIIKAIFAATLKKRSGGPSKPPLSEANPERWDKLQRAREELGTGRS